MFLRQKVMQRIYGVCVVCRGVARGGRGARAPLEFGRSVNPIQTRGAGYAQHITSFPTDLKSYLKHFLGFLPSLALSKRKKLTRVLII